MKKPVLLLSALLVACMSYAQELNCQVTILTPQIQTSDKHVFTTMQTAIYEFMNNTRWTGDKFLNQERIECTMQITINEMTGSDLFSGTVQVQSSRPIYKTSYN